MNKKWLKLYFLTMEILIPVNKIKKIVKTLFSNNGNYICNQYIFSFLKTLFSNNRNSHFCN